MKKQKRYLETGYQKWMTAGEFSQAKWWLEHRLNSPPTKMCIFTIAYLGLRKSEGTPIKRTQFNRSFSLFRYQPLKKRNKVVIKEKVVPKFLQEKLKDYHNRYSHKYRNDHMFFPWANQSENDYIRGSTIDFVFKRMREELKMGDVYYIRKDGNPLNRITCHTFRHYFAYVFCQSASRYLGEGLALRATQQELGHEKLETTMKYLNPLKACEQRRSIMDNASIAM